MGANVGQEAEPSLQSSLLGNGTGSRVEGV